MSDSTQALERLAASDYKYGFVTDIEQETVPPGLNEDVIRLISAKKEEPDWLLEWRLQAFRFWLTQTEPTWARVNYPPIDYQAISYYAAPKQKGDGPKSLDEIDPELRRTYEKLGIPLAEQAILAGVAVDAVFDSVSVATSYKGKLAEKGIIFCSFSEAVREHPDLVKKYLGSVVPYRDNFYATLNSAVFSDGSFVYIPPGVRCPMELSTYFRINASNTGQFEQQWCWNSFVEDELHVSRPGGPGHGCVSWPHAANDELSSLSGGHCPRSGASLITGGSGGGRTGGQITIIGTMVARCRGEGFRRRPPLKIHAMSGSETYTSTM